DDHNIGIFLDGKNRDHLAVAVGGLHVDDTLAAARREAVILERSALAVSMLGGREDQTSLFDNLHAHQEIAFFQRHSPNASRRPSHRADVLLGETDRLAPVRSPENEIVALS